MTSNKRRSMSAKLQRMPGWRWILGAAVAFSISAGAVPERATADQARDPQFTGLPEMTPKELEHQNKTHLRVKSVKLNALGLVRANSDRLRKGKPQANPQQLKLARLGEELDAEILPGALPGTTGSSTPSAGSTLLPSYVDNSFLKYFPAISSQGSLNSCGPFSGTYYTMTYMNALARNLDVKSGGPALQLSPKWTYNMLNGGANVGNWYYDAYNIGIRHGCATMQQFPYDSNYRAWSLDPTVWRDAISRRFASFGYVGDTHLDSGMTLVKQMLANGYILNIATYINSWQWKTLGNDPSTTADDAFVGKSCAFWVNGTAGYHAMTVVGFNDEVWVDINGNGLVEPGEKGAFRIANSWGTGWREAGFSWMAYDALRTASAVPGGPALNRIPGWDPTRAHWVTARPNYAPVLLAEVTLNHAQRNQMRLSLGISDPTATTPLTTWAPAMLVGQGGAFAFNGTTTPVDGTFVLDFSDLAPSVTANKRFYLTVNDSAVGNATSVKQFKLIDLANGGAETISADAPLSIDGSTAHPKVDYVFSDGNLAPIADFTVTVSGTVSPVSASFNASTSLDEDGVIASYTWSFGDGSTGSGASPEHTYTAPGTYQPTLTVTDDRGATDSAVATIVVNQNPNLKLHVASIAMSVVKTKSGRTATARVKVVDAAGVACPGATVSGQWSGVINGSSSGTTGSDGLATLLSPKTKRTGTFIFKVSGITKAGYAYDAAANAVTQASIP